MVDLLELQFGGPSQVRLLEEGQAGQVIGEYRRKRGRRCDLDDNKVQQGRLRSHNIELIELGS